MAQLFNNNARALLTGAIIAGDTTLTVEAGKADSFPVANTNASAVGTSGLDWFKAVLEDVAGNLEIIYVRTRTAGSGVFSNIIRGQEGTTARAFAAGSVVGLRLTALDLTTALALAAIATIQGRAMLSAADAAAQRTLLAVGATGDTLFQAANAAAARNTLSAPSRSELQTQAVTAFTTTGTATAYTAAPADAITAYAAPLRFDVTFHLAAGAAPTLQINSIASPPTLVKQMPDGTIVNIAANDWPAGHTSPVRLLSATQALVERLPAAATNKILINSQSAAYTMVLADEGKCIYHPTTDTTARIWTIPSNASVPYPIGSCLTFDNDIGAGAITIAITTDTLVLVGPGTTGSRTLAAGGQATALKVTATRWRISGTGLT